MPNTAEGDFDHAVKHYPPWKGLWVDSGISEDELREAWADAWNAGFHAGLSAGREEVEW